MGTGRGGGGEGKSSRRNPRTWPGRGGRRRAGRRAGPGEEFSAPGSETAKGKGRTEHGKARTRTGRWEGGKRQVSQAPGRARELSGQRRGLSTAEAGAEERGVEQAPKDPKRKR